MWIRASMLCLMLTTTVHAGPVLPECPASPNCVSSLAADPDKRVDPLPGAATPEASRQLLLAILSEQQGVSLEGPEHERRIHAVFRTRLFGFRDDVHFHIRDDGRIEVRSASRLGYWDLGTNRRRVEKLRDTLQQKLAND